MRIATKRRRKSFMSVMMAGAKLRKGTNSANAAFHRRTAAGYFASHRPAKSARWAAASVGGRVDRFEVLGDGRPVPPGAYRKLALIRWTT